MTLATARYDPLRDEARYTQLHSATPTVLVHAARLGPTESAADSI